LQAPGAALLPAQNFPLHSTVVVAIVPALNNNQTLIAADADETGSRLIWPVRLTLLGFALAFAVVLGVALRLDPTKGGRNWTQATHTQLGLAPCQFFVLTGMPCPSCGMTTSFTWLVHGNPVNSMRANWVGTMLATFCLLFIPWSVASVIRKRALFIDSIEIVLARLIMVFLWLLVIRWGVVILLMWHNGLL
jgi:hypothetical protein